MNLNDNNYDSRFQKDFNNDFQNVFEDAQYDDNIECEMILQKSASMNFSMTEYYTIMLQEQKLAYKAHAKTNGRTKIFNCSFKLFKKRDINRSIQNYKCGQSVKCFVSFIHDTKQFYVQQNSRLNDLKDMETCIQNYANVLLSDDKLTEELYSFQTNTAQFDVVLVKAKWDNKWHRAIYLGVFQLIIKFII